MPLILQDEIYKIARKMMRNAVIRADANHIEAEIRYDKDQLRLRIRDDGKGIDPKTLEADGRPRTLGHRRDTRAGTENRGATEFWYEAGAGTEARLALSRFNGIRKAARSPQVRVLPREQIAMAGVSSTIRILVVDDHAFLRKGISVVVNAAPDMKLVAEASNGEEAIEMFRLHRPDVTLMDLQMPGENGIETMNRILAEFPDARIIVLTTFGGDANVLRALRAGARSYLLKGHVRDFLEAIRTVHRGGKRIPPEIAAELAEHAVDEELSPREIEVLRLIAAGHSNKRIGDLLSISEPSVKSHVTSILSKLSANDRTHAVTIALKRGIIEI